MKIDSLFIYPVKGMRAWPLREAKVERWGLAGDRLWAVVDAQGRVLNQRHLPRLATIAAEPAPDGIILSAKGAGSVEIAFPGGEDALVRVYADSVKARQAGPAASAWLSHVLGASVELVHLSKPELARPLRAEGGRQGESVSLADAYPVLLTSTASLECLNSALPGAAVLMDRFRPNIVVAHSRAWEEEGLELVFAGEARFRGSKPCERCVVITIDQASGERPDKLQPLATLTRINGGAAGRPIFGQNLIPETEGVIRVGQVLTAAPRDVGSAAP
jgi:uncharacterized protein YcbX